MSLSILKISHCLLLLNQVNSSMAAIAHLEERIAAGSWFQEGAHNGGPIRPSPKASEAAVHPQVIRLNILTLCLITLLFRKCFRKGLKVE